MQLVPWMVVMAVACEGGQRAAEGRARQAAGPTGVQLLNRWELDAYAAGTAAEIRLLRNAIQSGLDVDRRGLDSAGAAAAGTSPDGFRAISLAVEAALKARFAPTAEALEVRLVGEAESTFARRAGRLDSLRVDLLMLRVRARGLP